MASQRKRVARPAAAVLLSKREWREYVKASADIQAALCAARDLVVQLQALLADKRRRSAAASRANATRQTITEISQPETPTAGGCDW